MLSGEGSMTTVLPHRPGGYSCFSEQKCTWLTPGAFRLGSWMNLQSCFKAMVLSCPRCPLLTQSLLSSQAAPPSLPTPRPNMGPWDKLKSYQTVRTTLCSELVISSNKQDTALELTPSCLLLTSFWMYFLPLTFLSLSFCMNVLLADPPGRLSEVLRHVQTASAYLGLLRCRDSRKVFFQSWTEPCVVGFFSTFTSLWLVHPCLTSCLNAYPYIFVLPMELHLHVLLAVTCLLPVSLLDKHLLVLQESTEMLLTMIRASLRCSYHCFHAALCTPVHVTEPTTA